MLAPSEYQTRCKLCGFHSSEFIQGSSFGIGQETGPNGPFNPFTERYAYLCVKKQNVICINCGTLHERRHAGIDYPLWPVLLIIAACLVIVTLTAVVWADLVTLIIASALACFIAVISIQTFRSAFSKQVRSRYCKWIAEIESGANTCPQCGCGDAVGLTRKSLSLPCPQCAENTLSLVCTFKGIP